MDSSRRSERQQFKSITVLRHTVFLGSKPKENGVLGLPGSPNATCERRWVGRFWTVTHEVLGNPEVGSRVNATASDPEFAGETTSVAMSILDFAGKLIPYEPVR
jgi:hypothetical protein